MWFLRWRRYERNQPPLSRMGGQNRFCRIAHNKWLDILETGSACLQGIVNSIGAYFSMNAGIDVMIRSAYFISPIVDMERLILNMMSWVNVTETELEEKGVISTSFGEDLSWEYLCYVREHPVCWTVPTRILYGSRDNLTSYETISAFAETHGAELTVMEEGEHWFHTDEQMRFLDNWIIKGRSIQ